MKKLFLMSFTLLFFLLHADGNSVRLFNPLDKAVYLRATIDGKLKSTTLHPGSQEGLEVDWDRTKLKEYRISGTRRWITMPQLPQGTYSFVRNGNNVFLEALYILNNERLSDNPHAYGDSVFVRWPGQSAFSIVNNGSRDAAAIPYTGKPITILYTTPALVTAWMAQNPLQDDQETVRERLSKQITLPLPGTYYLEQADKDGYPTFTHESAHTYFANNPNLILIRTYYPIFPIHIKTNGKEYEIDPDKYGGKSNFVTIRAPKFPFTLRYWSQDEGERTMHTAKFTRGGFYHVFEQDGHPFIETARGK